MADNILSGRVIKVINEYELVINRGSLDGVKANNRFLIYRLDEEITDPDTNEDLGRLELVCGEGTPKHIQERFTTLRSCLMKTPVERKIVKRQSSLIFAQGSEEEICKPKTETTPFEEADTDCLFRQIR